LQGPGPPSAGGKELVVLPRWAFSVACLLPTLPWLGLAWWTGAGESLKGLAIDPGNLAAGLGSFDGRLWSCRGSRDWQVTGCAALWCSVCRCPGSCYILTLCALVAGGTSLA